MREKLLANPQRILLLPMCGLGDAVCYLPFVQTLRKHFPESEIVAVVATGPASVILEKSGANIEIIVFNREGQRNGWRFVWNLIVTMRRRKFDVVVSGAHPDSVRIPLFALLCGAPAKVGSRSEKLNFLYNRKVEVSTYAHYFDRYRALLTGLGIFLSPEEYRPRLEPPQEAKGAADQIWSEAGLDGAALVIGLVSGADVNSRGKWQPSLKRWSNEAYASVVKWISVERGARVVMFGGPDEARFAASIGQISAVPVVDLCGKTGLGELQWLIGKCTVIVSNDTGLMHIAGALDSRMVALFGPTTPDSFHPPGSQTKIAKGTAPCSPCYPHPTCDLKSCLAMENLAPIEVISRISLHIEPSCSVAKTIEISSCHR